MIDTQMYLEKVDDNRIFTIRKIRNQNRWSKEEDERLLSLAENFQEKHWKEISKSFVKKNSLQCFSRFKRIKPGLVKGLWTQQEDSKIVELVNIYGKSWSKIARILGTRNGKQIRDRFINVLDSQIKRGKFCEEEDELLIALYKQYGSKWASIAKYFPNRTPDMIKNRFHSSLKKKLNIYTETEKASSKSKLCLDDLQNFSRFETNEESYNKSMNECSSVTNLYINSVSFSPNPYAEVAQDNYNVNNTSSQFEQMDYQPMTSFVCEQEPLFYINSNNDNLFEADLFDFRVDEDPVEGANFFANCGNFFAM